MDLGSILVRLHFEITACLLGVPWTYRLTCHKGSEVPSSSSENNYQILARWNAVAFTLKKLRSFGTCVRSVGVVWCGLCQKERHRLHREFCTEMSWTFIIRTSINKLHHKTRYLSQLWASGVNIYSQNLHSGRIVYRFPEEMPSVS